MLCDDVRLDKKYNSMIHVGMGSTLQTFLQLSLNIIRSYPLWMVVFKLYIKI